jgi:hypothetical protein
MPSIAARLPYTASVKLAIVSRSSSRGVVRQPLTEAATSGPLPLSDSAELKEESGLRATPQAAHLVLFGRGILAGRGGRRGRRGPAYPSGSG